MNHSKILILISLILISAYSCKNESIEQKAARIHRNVLTIDSHTDTPLWFTRANYDLNKKHDPYEHRSKIDLPRMSEGNLDAVFFAAFIGQSDRTPEGNKKAIERTNKIIDSIYSNVNRYPEKAVIALSAEDAISAEENNKKAIFIGIENGYALGNDIKNVEEYYKRGVRYITLCHTRNNDICDSSTDSTEHNGLSKFGEEVVKEMNRLGIMIDVSHISDSAFYNVIELSEYPVIASHSSARAICDNPRNLSDDMLLKLKENGGVAQMCILSSYVKDPEPNPERDTAFNQLRRKYNYFKNLSEEEYEKARQEWIATDKKYPRKLATVSDFVDHIDHVVDLIGIDYVGIGTDFDGGGGLKDCYDVSQMGNITLELVRRGYTENEIRKIWGGNLIRVMDIH